MPGVRLLFLQHARVYPRRPPTVKLLLTRRLAGGGRRNPGGGCTGRTYTSVLGTLGSAYALAGRRSHAERILAQLQALPGATRYAQASVYASLGNADRAFALLGEAVEQRESSAPDLGIHPVFARYRADRRMAPLLRRIGLPAAK